MGETMTDRSVRVAISIKNPVAQQLACEMFGTTGVKIDVFDDAAAIIDVADTIQAIVLGLDAFPEDTLEALVLLRKRLATTPIFVIAAAAGQRHTERAALSGATQVIPYSELKLRVGPLVQEIARSSGIQDWGIRSPGWSPPNSDQGYDIESMDLNAWLAIPGNRRLLGMQEEPKGNDATSSSGEEDGVSKDKPTTEPNPIAPTNREANAQSASAAEPAPPVAVDSTDWAQIPAIRARQHSEDDAVSEDHLRREKQLMAELKSEFLQAMTRKIASTEAKILDHIDESLAKTMRDNAAAVRQVKLMAGVIAGTVVFLVLAAVAVIWRLEVF